MKTLVTLYPKQSRNAIFIGYDPREHEAALVLESSLRKWNYNSGYMDIHLLKTKDLRDLGLYIREYSVTSSGQMVDKNDERPFSVDFSFTRFLVPHIAKELGYEKALFIDCDFLCLGPLYWLFETDLSSSTVAVVKHDFTPTTELKMDGVSQIAYPKKLWSAAMLFNVEEAAKVLPVEDVNSELGSYLHQFGWVSEDKILGLPEVYHFVPFHSEKNTKKCPELVHFTERAPWFDEPNKDESIYARLWYKERNLIKTSVEKERN